MVDSEEKPKSANHGGRHGAAAATPTSQVTAFLTYFVPSNGNYGDVTNLIKLFSDDIIISGVLYPIVGITDHAAPGQTIGPGYHGKIKIAKLFTQLFNAFKNSLILFPIDTSPYLQSSDNLTLAVRLTLTGLQVGSWFAKKDPDYSLPLSEIQPQTTPKNSTIPACAVFTFDGNTLIQQLALYMDRYKLMKDLQPESGTNFDLAIITFLNNL